MSKILVTGASGNVGSYVIEALLDMEVHILAAGTDVDKLKKQFASLVERHPKAVFEVVNFDFTNPQTYAAALEGVDRIFLMRPPHLGKPEDLYPFIEAAKAKGIKLMSFLSLMGVESNTIPPHHKIEKFIEAQGIPYAHIRPGFFMQNVSGIHAEEIRENDEIFIPAGNSKTSFIDAKDIGLAIATVLHQAESHQNTAYTITGPESLNYHDVAAILSDVTGRPITYAKPGFLSYRHRYIHGRGLNKNYVHVTMALYLMTRLGTAKAVTHAFQSLTGKEPRTFRAFAEANKKAFIKS